MKNLVIKPASKEEFSIAVGWAAQEGWNPGLADLDAFFAADPNGFLMAWYNDEPVASISVVKYGEAFGFLGFYIVHPQHRGKGFGISIWNAGMEYLGNRTVGLDGVLEQQKNYEKSGFTFVGKNIRHTGTPVFASKHALESHVRNVMADDFDAICAFDQPLFQTNRDQFIKVWVDPKASPDRITKIVEVDGELQAFGTIRACRDRYKIGPLFANDKASAYALFEQLCSEIPNDCEVSLDVPEANKAGAQMAVKCGLVPAFETARMYFGPYKDLDFTKQFGITTFELG